MLGDRRIERMKRWGYLISRTVGPVTVHGEVSSWAFPWPSVTLYLEPGELTLGFRLDGGMTDPLLATSLTVRVPERVTELLHRVRPYEDEYMGPEGGVE